MPQTAKLTVSIDGQPETTLELGERLTMGRSTTNQLVLPDQNASRRHAEIRSIGHGNYRLFDVGSANGTWVNGRRLTVPRELEDGDQICVGAIVMIYHAPEAGTGTETGRDPSEDTFGQAMYATAVAMKNETVVVFVSDIRSYTAMSETIPAQSFSRLISDWFKVASEIIESSGGTIDKFIGDAVMAYWTTPNLAAAAPEINKALDTARKMIETAEQFSIRLGAEHPGHTFRVGIGINIGEAVFGNVGTSTNQSFTIVGDCVNVAFRLESLCKEKKAAVLVGAAIAEFAEPQYVFQDLGLTEVKGRREPVQVLSMKLEPETQH